MQACTGVCQAERCEQGHRHDGREQPHGGSGASREPPAHSMDVSLCSLSCPPQQLGMSHILTCGCIQALQDCGGFALHCMLSDFNGVELRQVVHHN